MCAQSLFKRLILLTLNSEGNVFCSRTISHSFTPFFSLDFHKWLRRYLNHVEFQTNGKYYAIPIVNIWFLQWQKCWKGERCSLKIHIVLPSCIMALKFCSSDIYFGLVPGFQEKGRDYKPSFNRTKGEWAGEREPGAFSREHRTKSLSMDFWSHF